MEEQIIDARKQAPKKPVLTIVLVIILVLALGALGAYAFYPNIKSALTGATPTPTASSPTAQVVSPTASPIASKVVDEGVTWVKMTSLDDPGLFEQKTDPEGTYEYTGTDYYKVAQTSTGNDIILAEVKISAMGDFNELHRFIKRDGKYYRLSQNSDEVTNNGYSVNYSGDESSFVLKSLLADKVITEGETELVFQKNLGPSESEGLSAAKKVGSTKWGDLNRDPGRDVDNSDGKVKASRYVIVLNDGTYAVYEPKPTFLLDDGSFDITSSKNAGGLKYEKIATSGCGSGFGSFPQIIDQNIMSGKEEFGKSKGGSKVYNFTKTDDPVNKFGYAVYTTDEGANKKTIQEFIDAFGVVVWIDAYGSPIVYANKDFKPEAECAKPVVYLYPEKETAVKVWVGARMTKTDPDYGSGWNVVAKPNGEVISSGKTYPYLFWEGRGSGLYPSIKTGTVVPTPDAVATIKGQLAKVGLNQKEIADFIEFWGPKMPQSSYVRLTWLLNKEMDELAPIKIAPKPDTIIRVFLDFEGLNQKEDIASQVLPSIPRRGFTAVEWGGLLVK